LHFIVELAIEQGKFDELRDGFGRVSMMLTKLHQSLGDKERRP